MSNTESNDKIIKKIQGLIKLANDNKDDEEAKTALLLAQRLSVKHNIDMSLLEEESERKMVEMSITEPKKRKWYETDLAIVIADNFKVRMYYMRHNGGKRSIMFFGYEEDCQLAREIYHLALQSLEYMAKEHVELFYIFEGRYKEKTAKLTKLVKDSYMKGFIVGLNDSFESQTDELLQEYGLVTLMPVEVEDAFRKKEEEEFTGYASSLKSPSQVHGDSYSKGYEEGKDLDKTPRSKLEN